MATLISLDGGEVIIFLQKTKCSFLTPLQNVLSSLFSQTTFKVTFWVCHVPTSFSAKIGHGFTYMPMCTPLGDIWWPVWFNNCPKIQSTYDCHRHWSIRWVYHLVLRRKLQLCRWAGMDGSGTRSLSETNEGDESESNKSTAQRRGRMLPSLIIHSFGYLAR